MRSDCPMLWSMRALAPSVVTGVVTPRMRLLQGRVQLTFGDGQYCRIFLLCWAIRLAGICFKGGLVWLLGLAGCSASLRRNSHAEPCIRLVPDFNATFTCAEPMPNSDEYSPFWSLNS